METDAAYAERFKSLYPPGKLAEFARKTNIGYTTLAGYENGALPRLDKLVRIARSANVSVHWLATGEGPRDNSCPSSQSMLGDQGVQMRRELRGGTVLYGHEDDAVLLPRLTIEGSAGQGLIPTSEEVEDYLAVSSRYLAEIGISPRHAHVLRLSGHSMFPTLFDRDLIIIDTSRSRLRDEEIYSVVFGDTVLIKRLQPLWDGSIRIASDNKNGNYPDMIVPANDREQLRIIGRVGGYLRYF